MSASTFGSLIQLESTPQIANLAAVVRKDKQGIAQTPSDNDLDQLRRNSYPDVSRLSISVPVTPGELESRVDSPEEQEAIDRVPYQTSSSIAKWRLLSACLMNASSGMSDSGPGALIPYIEKDYNIGYAIVSLIFVTNALGFIFAAPFAQILEHKLGRSKSYTLSMSLLVAGFAIIIGRPPFAAIVASFFLLGFGTALNNALNNVFCANFTNSTAVLGVYHGAYGMGGTIGPLIATALASHGAPWSYYYSINLNIFDIQSTFCGVDLSKLRKGIAGPASYGASAKYFPTRT